MKNNYLQGLSTEELRKKESITKVVTYMLAGALLLSFCLNVYNSISKGFNALNIVPFAMLPILGVNFKNLNDIKKELNSRDEK
jgi:hypothetical protein